MAKQDAASQSMGNMTMSAKQTAFAMRGIPAQMTDIWVSIASGQKPMTVLLQQGGQLKDLFGGVGNAARAVGGYVLGMINPFTVLAGAIGLGPLTFVAKTSAWAAAAAFGGTGSTGWNTDVDR